MRPSRVSVWSRIAWAAVAVAALVWTFRDVEVARVEGALSKLGIAALSLVALPQFSSLCCESAAWRSVFAAISVRASFWQLLRVRLQTEALAQTLPAGVVLAESIKPYLLGRHCRIPAERAIAGVAARKFLLLASQAVYILTCATLGFGALGAASTSIIGSRGLEWLVLGSGAGVAVAAIAFRAMLGRGRVAARLLGGLRLLPKVALRARVDRSAARFHRTDAELAALFRAGPRRLVKPGFGFLCSWLLEALETFVILRLLGTELDFSTVAGFEVALSFLRNLVFVLPAGLGLQDVGYVLFLRALGVPDALAVGAAFSVLKRGKELFWSLAGYALLAWDARGRRHQLVWTP